MLPLVLMDYCFSEDTQLFTSAGFLSLDAFAALSSSSADLHLGAVDPVSGALVWQRASRLIVNPARPRQRLVRFDSERSSLLVTPEHDMWIWSNRRGCFRKVCGAAFSLLVVGSPVFVSAQSGQSGGPFCAHAWRSQSRRLFLAGLSAKACVCVCL